MMSIQRTSDMTFPLETEATIRRRMLDICTEQSRNLVEITRELALMIDSMAEGSPKEARIHYENMLKLVEVSGKQKNVLIEEVTSVGSLLISRDDFLRLIFQMDHIFDYAEAVGFRLVGILDGKLKIEKTYLTALSSLMSQVLNEISKVRETMMALAFNRSKAVELSARVEEIERKTDYDTRNLDLEILGSRLPLPSLLLLREIVDRIERILDLGVDVVDLIRVLALTG